MSERARGRRRPWPLHAKILWGLVLGAAGGIAANRWSEAAPWVEWVTANLAQPVGQIFLRMLFMLVVPLVFASLTLGVAGLGDLKRIGRLGLRTLAVFVATTAIAATLGLSLVNLVRPGEALAPEARAELMEAYAPQAAERVTAASESGFGIQTFVQIVPRNPIDAAARGDMLGLIFFTLIFGIAITRLPRETAAPLLRVIEAIGKAVEVMIGFAMKLAPIGVAGLIFAVTARFGVDLLGTLGQYVLVVLAGLAIHLFGVIALLARALARVAPRDFYRRNRALIATAFSTSSSNATLPTTMRTAEREFGVSSQISGFVLPLGATMNMNGTALFEGVTVLFLAQVFGVDLSLGTQLIVVVMSVITAIGAAGVPSGSIPLLIVVCEMVGVPGEGIALILGVDRILDMARTVPNVVGDLLTSLIVSRWERGEPHMPEGGGSA